MLGLFDVIDSDGLCPCTNQHCIANFDCVPAFKYFLFLMLRHKFSLDSIFVFEAFLPLCKQPFEHFGWTRVPFGRLMRTVFPLVLRLVIEGAITYSTDRAMVARLLACVSERSRFDPWSVFLPLIQSTSLCTLFRMSMNVYHLFRWEFDSLTLIDIPSTFTRLPSGYIG